MSLACGNGANRPQDATSPAAPFVLKSQVVSPTGAAVRTRIPPIVNRKSVLRFGVWVLEFPTRCACLTLPPFPAITSGVTDRAFAVCGRA
jgi:hypothetical protein